MIAQNRIWIFFIPNLPFKKKSSIKRNTKEFILFLCLAIIMAGCVRPARYGEEISDQQVTRIESILANSADYEGKTVKVEGKIITECPSGCWIDLKGETGVIHVTLPAFAIPQEVGKIAVVEGEVSSEAGRLIIIGKGVEIK